MPLNFQGFKLRKPDLRIGHSLWKQDGKMECRRLKIKGRCFLAENSVLEKFKV